jgi:hypothetical protein
MSNSLHSKMEINNNSKTQRSIILKKYKIRIFHNKLKTINKLLIKLIDFLNFKVRFLKIHFRLNHMLQI